MEKHYIIHLFTKYYISVYAGFVKRQLLSFCFTNQEAQEYIELDVTEARKMINAKKKLKEKVSFNSWMIKCISHSVEEAMQVHGIRKGKRKVVIFNDIDISIMIEREVDGKKVPLPYVIRKTNEKSITDIDNEIRVGQKQMINGEGNFVLGEKKNDLLMRLYYGMPGFLRSIIWRYLIRSPFLVRLTKLVKSGYGLS